MTWLRQRRWLVLTALAILAVAVPAVCCFIGEIAITPGQVLDGNSDAAWVFRNFRLPRVLVGFLAGVGLALCGMAFQALFRNPLTTPYTLGVASGASLGAVAAILSGLTFTVLGVSGLAVFAFIGALLSVFLIYGLSRLHRSFDTNTLLLAGVALSFCFSSLILFLQFRSDFHDSYRIIRWMMGGLQVPGPDAVFDVLPFVVAGVAVIVLYLQELNLLSTGEELAVSRGVDVDRTKKLLFFASSLAVGGIVATCGPIGFVGLMAPHICRLMVGPDHRYLAPATALFGGSFLVLCDTVARTILTTAEIPVGVITALLGGPYFLILLCLGGTRRHF